MDDAIFVDLVTALANGEKEEKEKEKEPPKKSKEAAKEKEIKNEDKGRKEDLSNKNYENGPFPSMQIFNVGFFNIFLFK